MTLWASVCAFCSPTSTPKSFQSPHCAFSFVYLGEQRVLATSEEMKRSSLEPEVFPNFRNKKRKTGRDERESCSQQRVCVYISPVNCLQGDVCEEGWVFMSFHHFPSSSKSNYFSLSFPSWKIA